MQNNRSLKFQLPYAVQEEAISPFASRICFQTESGKGEMILAKLYQGVQVWSVRFAMASMEVQPADAPHCLKLNYCFSGCCEASLPDGGSLYISQGSLCTDMNQPVRQVHFPSGLYTGLQIVAGMGEASYMPPHTWTECEINPFSDAKRLSEKNGRAMTNVTPEWVCAARKLAASISFPDSTRGDCRFLLLHLLWLLKMEAQYENGSLCLTKGQYAVVARAMELMTRNLQQRYAIAELAADLGISSTSLKKYFSLVYGKPISVFMRELRITRAKELLTTTSLSIANVASEVGYENQGKFGAMFRREVGVTPLEYRRINRLQTEWGSPGCGRFPFAIF